MSLRDWHSKGWLVEHQTSREEIADLLGVADRDLESCQTPGLIPDWQLSIAHNSALQAATAALAACGYRSARHGHHYRVIQSLFFTIGADRDLVDRLDAFRKKRNLAGYERASAVSEQEATEMVDLARLVRREVETWLRHEHPEFT